MVKFNNKKLKIYDLDSINSIIKRLASDQNTLPHLIYFPNGEPTIDDLTEDTDIIYQNLLIFIKDNLNFTELNEKLKDKLSLLNIVYYHILFYKNYDIIDEYELANVNDKGTLSGSAILLLNEEIEKVNQIEKIDVNKLWNNI